MTDIDLYRYSLVAAIPLMLFMGGIFVLRNFSTAPAYRRYAAARRRIGLALILLSLNYIVHLLATPRLSAPEWGVFLNVSTYYLVVWLFASSLLSLLTPSFNSPRRDRANVGLWLLFSSISAVALWLLPHGAPHIVVDVAFAFSLLLFTLHHALNLIRTYKHAVWLLDSYHSDDVAAYIRWMSVFMWLAVGYGLAQGVFTFLPDRYVFIWILSSIPFYCYAYISYTNYVMAVKLVDEAIEEETEEPLPVEKNDSTIASETHSPTAPSAADPLLDGKLEEWIAQGKFARQGVTIAQLAQEIGSNRTYLSTYINRQYSMSFRDWINALRLDYAKRLLTTQPDLTVNDVAQRAGYLSLSNFSRLFTASEGVPPGRWRKEKG
jgi:AraC-like DNA-binding protein